MKEFFEQYKKFPMFLKLLVAATVATTIFAVGLLISIMVGFLFTHFMGTILVIVFVSSCVYASYEMMEYFSDKF